MATLTRPIDSPGILQRERPLRPDLFLLVPLVVLMGLGIIMVFTASRARLEAVGAPVVQLEVALEAAVIHVPEVVDVGLVPDLPDVHVVLGS